MSESAAGQNPLIVSVARVAGVAPGRSAAGSHAGLIWLVATDEGKSPGVEAQIAAALRKVDRLLKELGSRRENIISATMYLTEENHRSILNGIWDEWVGSDRRYWPQRCCVVVDLSPGTLFEITAVAAVG